MATQGAYISGIGHAGLLVWLFAGWGLSSDPLDFEPIRFTGISSEEFDNARLRSTPTPSVAEPTAPSAPELETQPEVPATDEAPDVAPPEPTEPPVEELPPPEAPEPPAPPSEVTDVVPDVTTPALEPTPAIDAPIVSERPQPRAADRVAPVPVAPPEPDVAIAEIDQQSAEPAETPDEPAPVEPVEETAQEETATEIVTEADTPSGAVETSLRPAARPSRPEPAEEPAEPVTETATAEPAEDPAPDTSDAVEDLLAGIVSEPDVPQGPPMTGPERDGFRVAVNACWNVDPGSVAARVTVVVGFSLDQGGKVAGDVRMVSASGGDDGAERH